MTKYAQALNLEYFVICLFEGGGLPKISVRMEKKRKKLKIDFLKNFQNTRQGGLFFGAGAPEFRLGREGWAVFFFCFMIFN